MALSNPRRGLWWSRLHFVVRFLGLTGLLVGGIGLLLSLLQLDLSTWEAAQALLTNPPEDLFSRVALGLLLGGAAAALLAFLVEIVVALSQIAGRRSAFGLNVGL